jgi:flagellar biosynthetic protein FlhB
MNSETESSEKEHDPTPQRLEEARKKGEIPQSRDLMAAAAYAGLAIGFLVLGAPMVERFGLALGAFFAQADSLSEEVFKGAGSVLGGYLQHGMWGFGVLLLVPLGAVLAVATLQRLFVFVPSKVQPKLSRISPIEGAKNKFGRKGLFEFAKSTLKLILVSVALGGFIILRLEAITLSLFLSQGVAILLMLRLLLEIFALFTLIQLALGVVDYLFQHAEHQRKNRMSRTELLDEMKHSEGDPHMKAQRRQRGAEIASNRMLADVARADVVIVNPTHYAVALKWSRSSRGAPVCLAKGVDEIAARIRERAVEHGVPIHSDPPTARALHASVEIGQQIPPQTYQAVAAAIRFSEAMRSRVRARGLRSRNDGAT